ncbi:MAG: hypothetical protein HZA46_19660 [Planctomycetales bacterium]|nr:hypothetical protein [Planctomycetales bacterium]
MSTTWPHSTDYFEAVQMPAVCFSDSDLQAATVATEASGMPRRPCSGNFADVYQFLSSDGRRSWAVKCFTRPVSKLNERYREISQHLEQAKLPFSVEFKYLEQGVRIRGQWYPVVKMDWVEGLTLRQFVAENLEKPQVLDVFFQVWLKVLSPLRKAQAAHGDLQHGNVMLVRGSSERMLALKLIDYDGMWVPALGGHPPGEVGHPCYQHPQRTRRSLFTPDIDRFPHLVIACALKCLVRSEGPSLWREFDNGENLLFTKSDFDTPAKSPLLQRLWNSGGPDLRAWVGHLTIASQSPLEATPFTERLYSSGKIEPLTGEVERQVSGILGAPKVAPKPRKATPPTAPVEETNVVVQENAFDDLFSSTSAEELQKPLTPKAKPKKPIAIDDDEEPVSPAQIGIYVGGSCLALVLGAIFVGLIVQSLSLVVWTSGLAGITSLGVGMWLGRLGLQLSEKRGRSAVSLLRSVATALFLGGSTTVVLSCSVGYWHFRQGIQSSVAPDAGDAQAALARLPGVRDLKLTGLGDDLPQVLNEAIRLLEKDDIATFVQCLYPPTELVRLQKADQMQALLQQFKETPELAKAMLEDFVRMQSVKPELTDNGSVAVFTLPEGISQSARTIKLQMMSGNWRLFDDAPRVSKELTPRKGWF